MFKVAKVLAVVVSFAFLALSPMQKVVEAQSCNVSIAASEYNLPNHTFDRALLPYLKQEAWNYQVFLSPTKDAKSKGYDLLKRFILKTALAENSLITVGYTEAGSTWYAGLSKRYIVDRLGVSEAEEIGRAHV